MKINNNKDEKYSNNIKHTSFCLKANSLNSSTPFPINSISSS